MKKIYQLVLALLLVHGTVFAQEKLLDKTVNLSYENSTLKEILTDISVRYGVLISYSSTQIPVNKKITITIKEESLKTALTKLLEKTGVEFVESGNQVVLKRGEVKKEPEAQEIVPDDPKVSPGKEKGASGLLNEDNLLLKEAELPVQAESEKQLNNAYVIQQSKIYDTYFSANDTTSLETEKYLKEDLKAALEALKDRVKILSDSLKLQSQLLLSKGIAQDTVLPSDEKAEGVAQMSFIYPIGTNGVESGKYSNKFSLNVLGGYARGVEGTELAGLINIDKEDVKGFQMAGLLNIVGGDLKGVQVSGFNNIVKSSAKGVQAAGFGNITGDTSDVFQAAGFFNINKGANLGGQFAGFTNINSGSMVGPQGAGFLNVVKGNMKGIQTARFANITSEYMEGFQGAGFLNVASKNMRGLQTAGFANIIPTYLKGVQVSGFLNYAQEVKGVQVGVFNFAGKIKGTQIGVFNFADSVSSAQFGFFSYSRKGYRKLELSGGLALYPSLSFKTGTKTLYNIFSAGLKPDQDWKWWFGYGLGTELSLSESIPLDIELLSSQVNRLGHGPEQVNLLNQLKLTVGYTIGKITVFAGSVFNAQVISATDAEQFKGLTNAPYEIWEESYVQKHNDNNKRTYVTMWPGFTAGIRL